MTAGNGAVLVVEDDPDINGLVGAYVELAGYRYLSAMDGNEGLRQARERHPGLIVLDVMLPDLNGFEVCRRLKSEADTSAIPVVMLTALNKEADRNRGLECGAADYIAKPFHPDHLIAAIRANAMTNGA